MTREEFYQSLKSEIEGKTVNPILFAQHRRVCSQIPTNKNKANIRRLSEFHKAGCRHLRKKYQIESMATFHERRAFRVIQEITNYEVKRQYWIGNHCLDFYFPAFRTGFEIDGEVHDREFKIKKDYWRDINLAQLGVVVSSIRNDQITTEFPKVLKSLTLPRDERGKNPNALLHETKLNILKKIHIFTILVHLGLNYDFSRFKK